MSNIEELTKKYSEWKAKANALEAQYKEAQQNAESYQRVIDDLKKQSPSQPIIRQAATPELHSSEKYSHMTMNAAICDLLKLESKLSTAEIYQKLIEGGFRSNSQTLKRDVATKLSGLKKHRYIESTVVNGSSRFSLLSNEIPTKRRKKL